MDLRYNGPKTLPESGKSGKCPSRASFSHVSDRLFLGEIFSAKWLSDMIFTN
jgi:hypothetical protein